jgi:hypothetical protein
LIAFLLYVTAIGVSASTQPASTVNTLREPTKTVTKTVHDTTTIHVTTTSTSYVCCQTTTTTVTQPPSTTTETQTNTVTETSTSISTTTVTRDQVLSGNGSPLYSSDVSLDVVSGSLDCQVTLSLRTFGVVANSPASVNVEWYNGGGFGLGQNTVASTTLGDADGYIIAFSAATVQLNLVNMPASPTTSVQLVYSYTEICPV